MTPDQADRLFWRALLIVVVAVAMLVASGYFIYHGGRWALPGWIGGEAGLMLLGIGFGINHAQLYMTKPPKHRAPTPRRKPETPTLVLPRKKSDESDVTRIFGSY